MIFSCNKAKLLVYFREYSEMVSSSASSTTTVSVVVIGTIVSYVSAPFLFRALRHITEYIFGDRRKWTEENEGIRVLIKTSDKIVPIQLSPKWSISEVKQHLAAAVGKEAEELKIIVAGHELRDDVKVGDCDLGESTVIHAVKVIHRVPLPSLDSVRAQQDSLMTNLEGVSSVPSSFDTSISKKPDPVNDEATTSGQHVSHFKGDKPMNECLLDLQLTEEERLLHEQKPISNSYEDGTSSLGSDTHYDYCNSKYLNESPIIGKGKEQRIKAHFWVYCSDTECGRTIQPGKLRVRCESCKEGAIIVKSDPCNWDDVLNSGSIEGYCQNVSCPIMQVQNEQKSDRVRPVQFYFKCNGNNHNCNSKTTEKAITYKQAESTLSQSYSDEAPPLYLIRSNLKEIPCLG